MERSIDILRHPRKAGGHDMDLYDIHQEMKNDCGDAQERIAMEEEVQDPLRSPLPTGGNEWEKGFMESMKKAKKYGWELSTKQIETLERIRGDEDYYKDDYEPQCRQCIEEQQQCRSCFMEEIEDDTAHMSDAEMDAWNDYAVNVLGDRDVMSGSYGSVGGFRGACPLSYDSSGYSGGRGYVVEVCKRTGMTL